MSYRLPVIVLCSPASGPVGGLDAGSVVGHLLSVSGLDVRLVSDIPDASGAAVEANPEAILLSGIQGGAAVLAWQPCDLTFARLSAAKFRGTRGSHPADPQPASESETTAYRRSIFVFDLAKFDSADSERSLRRLATQLKAISDRLDLEMTADRSSTLARAQSGLPVLTINQSGRAGRSFQLPIESITSRPVKESSKNSIRPTVSEDQLDDWLKDLEADDR